MSSVSNVNSMLIALKWNGVIMKQMFICFSKIFWNNAVDCDIGLSSSAQLFNGLFDNGSEEGI